MRRRLPLFASIIILFASLSARAQLSVPQSGPPRGPESWKLYTVPHQEFSVALPTLPAMTTYPHTDNSRWFMLLGAYADGAIYTVGIYENLREQQSLDDLIAEQRDSPERRLGDLTPKRISVNGVAGKEFLRANGSCQFFGTQPRFYRFCVSSLAADDPRAKRFFSSIAFGAKQDGIAVSDGPGTPYQQDTGEPTLTGKEVDQKIRLGAKPDPMYTEEARRNAITGTVVLKAVFTSAGNVSDIRIVSGLPYGLTERAVAEAKKIKFIPAMKDGHYVSMWIQLEYYFNLY